MLRSPDDLLPDNAAGDLRRFVAYWIEKAAGRIMPSFSDIDAVDLPWALSRMYVVQALDRGSDFVYRLTGEELIWRYGFRLTGKRIGDLLAPAAAAAILACWHRVVDSPAAYYSVVQHLTTTGMPLLGTRVTLPLGPVGGPPDHIIGMTLFAAIGEGDDVQLSDRHVREARWVSLAPVA